MLANIDCKDCDKTELLLPQVSVCFWLFYVKSSLICIPKSLVLNYVL